MSAPEVRREKKLISQGRSLWSKKTYREIVGTILDGTLSYDELLWEMEMALRGLELTSANNRGVISFLLNLQAGLQERWVKDAFCTVHLCSLVGGFCPDCLKDSQQKA